MPAQRGKSLLLSKYGERFKKAHDKHRADETDYGAFSGLPAGIEGGIAQLESAAIVPVKEGKDNAGELEFRAVGVVKSPADFDGQRIYGSQTRIVEPLYDTPSRSRKTFEEHWAHVLNELRKLGVDTSDVGYDEAEDTIRALVEAAPHFRFRTWKGEKATSGPYKDREPMVQSSWMGLCEYEEDGGEAGAGLDDRSAGNGRAGREPFTGDTDEVPDEGAATGTADDLGALAEAAAQDDDEAIARLTELGLAAGMSQQEIDSAKTWASVVKAISEAGAAPDEEEKEEPEGEPDEEEEAEPGPEAKALPAPKDPVRYKPPDPKTKRPGRKAVECVVLTVDPKRKTASLRNLDNPKTVYKDVPWDQLDY